MKILSSLKIISMILLLAISTIGCSTQEKPITTSVSHTQRIESTPPSQTTPYASPSPTPRSTKQLITYTKEQILELNHQAAPNVFVGYGLDIDRSDIDIFLMHGEQSGISEITYDLVNGIEPYLDYATLSQIYHTMINHHPNYRPDMSKDVVYMEYTTEDYMREQFLLGCTTYALVYANMARALGIPAVLVEGLSMDYINRNINHLGGGMSGHFFVEVYLQGEWLLVDPTSGRLYINYDPQRRELPGGNILWAKGIDKWSFGRDQNGEEIPSPDDMHQILIDMSISAYQPTHYDFLGEELVLGDEVPPISYIGEGITFIGNAASYDSYLNHSVLKTTIHFVDIESAESTSKQLYSVVHILAINHHDIISDDLISMYPEINHLPNNSTTVYVKRGRRIAVLNYDNQDRLLNQITSLGSNFLTDPQYFSRDVLNDPIPEERPAESIFCGFDLSTLRCYFFVNGSDDSAFHDIISKMTFDKGFIYHYLENTDQYLAEVDILFVSGYIDYDALPSAFTQYVDPAMYASVDTDSPLFIEIDGTVRIIIAK